MIRRNLRVPNIVWQKAPIQIDQISLILGYKTLLYCLLVTFKCASMVKYESIMLNDFVYIAYMF